MSEASARADAFVSAHLDQAAALGERLGQAARARVLADYSWQAQVRKMEQVYEELGV